MNLVERRLAQLAALDQFSAQLELGPSVEETLNNLARSTVEATVAQAAVVILIENGAEITRVGTHRLPPEGMLEIKEAFRSLEDSPLHQAMRQGRPVLAFLQDLPAPLLRTSVPGYLVFQGLDKVLVTPLRTPSGSTLGTLHALFRQNVSPDIEDQRFQMTLARYASVAIENVQLLDSLQQQAIEQERHRLGRELHDSVSQTLFSIGLGTQAALEGLALGAEGVEESLRYVLSLARTGLEDLRTVIFKLHPESLADTGLVEALRRNVESLTTRYGIEVKAELPAEPDLSDAVKHALYRIGLEALHNSVKHSGAHLVGISLQLDEREVRLKVSDDGRGFEPSTVGGGHLGLVTMRERAEDLGGVFQLLSRPDQGTTVSVQIPRSKV